MKILHTADWHLGDRLGRINRTQDLRRAVERLAGYCENEKVDLLLVAGDLFSELSRADGLRDSVEHLQSVFLPFLLKGGTMLAITGNHDNENFCQALRAVITLAAPCWPQPGKHLPAGRLYLAPEPTFLRLADRAGHDIQFVLMPYPTARRYLDEPGQRFASVAEKNRNLQAAFGHKLEDIQRHPTFDRSLPTVLAAHIHVRGALLSGPFRMSEQDTILFPDGPLAAGFIYVALGHIHHAQCLMGRSTVRYSGSIERLDMGEWKDAKSAVLVDIDQHGLRGEPVCLPLPASPMYEVVVTNPHEEVPTLRERYPDRSEALVRIDLTYTAGRDSLDGILRELDQIFPRWYARTWREAGALTNAQRSPQPPTSATSFAETVLDYLQTELAEDDIRDTVLALAKDLLAEEQS